MEAAVSEPRDWEDSHRGAGWLSQLRSDSGSGHDPTVCEFELRVGLCADSSEPGPSTDSVSPSLSVPPPFAFCLTLPFKNE